MGRNKKSLHLDRENRKFLGVCAGIANFLEVDAAPVRLVFFISCIFGGWFLVPAYFALWFLLDESPASVRNSFSDNVMVNHFKNVDYRKKLYRNRRDAKLSGVCAGIADYLEVNVFAVRLVALAMLFMTFFFPVLLYIGATLVLDPKPLSEYDNEPVDFAAATRPRPDARATSTQTEAMGARKGARAGTDDRAGVHGNHFSKRREFQFCAHKFAALHGRLARMEAYVTSNRYRLHREFKNIS
ncbi:MAG: hypothetical protein RLZZ227_2344 [Pseudomonadota bacterium]|jgi:phage shock protein C